MWTCDVSDVSSGTVIGSLVQLLWLVCSSAAVVESSVYGGYYSVGEYVSISGAEVSEQGGGEYRCGNISSDCCD